jgi:hypothetical protein
VPLKHPSAPRVDFALEGDAHSSSFEAEVEPSDPGEEAADGEHVNAFPCYSPLTFLSAGRAECFTGSIPVVRGGHAIGHVLSSRPSMPYSRSST